MLISNFSVLVITIILNFFEDNFKAKVNTLKSDEAQASAMEHAIKHIINVKIKEKN